MQLMKIGFWVGVVAPHMILTTQVSGRWWGCKKVQLDQEYLLIGSSNAAIRAFGCDRLGFSVHPSADLYGSRSYVNKGLTSGQDDGLYHGWGVQKKALYKADALHTA